MSLDEIARAAVALVPDEGRAILGLAGAPGAGKTTLAEQLVEAVGRARGSDWVAHVPMDGFHLSDSQLRRLDALGRKGAPETFDALGYAHLLERLSSGHVDGRRGSGTGGRTGGEDVYAPGFDRTIEQPIAAALFVPPSTRLVVTEGNYLLLDSGAWPRAHSAMTQVWFVSGDEQVRHDRLVQRHVTFGKPEGDARGWVQRTDAPNAVLVEAGAARADRQVVNTPDGWCFTDERAPRPASPR